MGKSNLLKEAIADAKAVRETALANAKMRMEEAFTPRLQSMISTKLQNEIEGEDEEENIEEPAEVNVEPDADAEINVEPEADETEVAPEEPVDVNVEPEASADVDVEEPVQEPVEIETEPESDVDVEVEPSEEEAELDELDLESIIKELEDESNIDDDVEEPMFTKENDEYEEPEEIEEGDGMEKTNPAQKNTNKGMEDTGDVTAKLTGTELNAGGGEQVSPDRGKPFSTEIGAELPASKDLKQMAKNAIYEEEGEDEEGKDDEDVEINIDEILKELEENDYNGTSFDPNLSKTSNQSDPFAFQNEQLKTKVGSLTKDLKEHRQVIKFLKSKLNEVNLLNAKLLFTSKLFKSNNMNNSEKMKVIESFDRAKTLREVKLVYSTIAESVNGKTSTGSKKAVKKITESIGGASKPVLTMKKSTKKVLDEGIVSVDGAERLKKLAGIK